MRLTRRTHAHISWRSNLHCFSRAGDLHQIRIARFISEARRPGHTLVFIGSGTHPLEILPGLGPGRSTSCVRFEQMLSRYIWNGQLCTLLSSRSATTFLPWASAPAAASLKRAVARIPTSTSTQRPGNAYNISVVIISFRFLLLLIYLTSSAFLFCLGGAAQTFGNCWPVQSVQTTSDQHHVLIRNSNITRFATGGTPHETSRAAPAHPGGEVYTYMCMCVYIYISLSLYIYIYIYTLHIYTYMYI